MAEPSYYPLSPLKYSVEGTTSPSVKQHIKADSDPPHLADTVAADPRESRSSMFLAPLRPQRFRKGPSTGHPPSLWHTIKTPLVMALLPLVAIGYLAFCYTVHGKVVPVNTYGFYDATPQHLATIKGGITSVSIIIISIALYPIYDILSKLKSEEFFRALASHSHGVPLETINHVSTPSFGYVDMMVAMWRHRCSNYYIIGIVASLLVWVAATLAPGILTVDSVLADGELMAFAIGAVSPQSVLNGTSYTSPMFNAGLISDTAASIAWAEMELGVQYSFGVSNTSEPDYAAFIAPVPLDLSTTTSARWLSDVIGINPTCSWASTNLTAPVQLSTNSTSSFGQYLATAHLVDFNLDVKMTGNDLPLDSKAFAAIKDPSSSVTNHTTLALPSDGSTVFLLGQCQGSGCSSGINVDFTLDLTGLNTTFTIALIDQTWTMAILACIPNVAIETREVRNDGHGLFSVQPRPAGRQLTRQGNLNRVQTTALFSVSTSTVSQSGGKLTGKLGQYFPLGSPVQGDVLFGRAQFDGLPGLGAPLGTSVTISLASIEHITQGYTRILQSSAKPYLAGYLGTAYVPGRISQPGLVFAASIPHLAISSAVFALLAALLLLAHFRPGKGVEFTLVNVAAAVHESELPAQFAQIKGEQTAGEYGRIGDEAEGDTASDSADDAVGKGKVRRAEGNPSDGQQDIVEMLGDRRVFMQRRVDGSSVLHIG